MDKLWGRVLFTRQADTQCNEAGGRGGPISYKMFKITTDAKCICAVERMCYKQNMETSTFYRNLMVNINGAIFHSFENFS